MLRILIDHVDCVYNLILQSCHQLASYRIAGNFCGFINSAYFFAFIQNAETELKSKEILAQCIENLKSTRNSQILNFSNHAVMCIR